MEYKRVLHYNQAMNCSLRGCSKPSRTGCIHSSWRDSLLTNSILSWLTISFLSLILPITSFGHQTQQCRRHKGELYMLVSTIHQIPVIFPSNFIYIVCGRGWVSGTPQNLISFEQLSPITTFWDKPVKWKQNHHIMGILTPSSAILSRGCVMVSKLLKSPEGST